MFEITNWDSCESFLRDNKRAIIFFGSISCGHCRNIASFVKELTQQYPHVAFAHVEQSRVNCNNLKSMPTFVAYIDGEPKAQVVGAYRDKLQSMIMTELR